jgi:hypothetical protein
MNQPAWTHLSITVKGRKIDGEYSREGHLVRVKHDNRERVLPWEIRPWKRWLAISCARWRRKATPE